MKTRNQRVATLLITLLAPLMFTESAVAAPPGDWSKIEPSLVRLYYPGQSSFQWLRGKEHKKAFGKTRKGDSCASCHEEEEPDLGVTLTEEGRLEPTPIAGKNGYVELNVQSAYDEVNAYFRFQWKTQSDKPGVEHTQLRFDGKGWTPYGGSKLDKVVQKGEQPALFEDRLAIMIDDGSVPMFAEQGCWLTCHDGMPDMKREVNSQKIAADPVLGAKLKAQEVRKFIPGSRTDQRATWNKFKAETDITQMMADGEFIDLIQWRGQRTNAVSMADDGYILEFRHMDAGESMFSKNWDDATNQPQFMFDASKTGFKSRKDADLGDTSKASALITDSNAVPFDAAAGWAEGDLLPKFKISKTGASGSAADNADVKAEWKAGTWTLVWTRKLDTGNPDDKVLKAGSSVSVGFAIHDDGISGRGHHTAFPLTLGFGADADINAVKVD